MAVYAIGDIQGCYADLQRLLEQISYHEQEDQLIFLGDLVNRGPDSLEVLRFISQLDKCQVVLGNHDLHLIAMSLGIVQPGRHDTLQAILSAADGPNLIHWLRHQPLLVHEETLQVILVHAGLSPQWDLPQAKQLAREAEAALQNPDNEFFQYLYGDQPDYWQEDLSSWDRLRYIVNCLTRIRFCDQQGRLVLAKKAGPDRHKDLIPWYQCKEKIEQDIVFGHWSTLGLFQQYGVHCIDGGCLWGGQLVALRLDCKPYDIIQLECQAHVKPIGLS